eukprot:15366217-Ditylum_brightwellii.AAC.2
MDKALFHQHVDHFCQVDGTPPTHTHIAKFRLYAEQPLDRAFHNNTLDIDNVDTDNYTKEILKELLKTLQTHLKSLPT